MLSQMENTKTCNNIKYKQKEETLMRLEALAREEFSDKDSHLNKMKK